MGYSSDQVLQMYNTRMKSILTNVAKKEQERDEREYNDYIANQENIANLNTAVSLIGTVSKASDRKLDRLLKQTYDENKKGILSKKFEMKDPRSLKRVLKDIGTGENLKRLTARGKLKETEGYKEFQAGKAAEELERVRSEVDMPSLVDEEAVDELLPEEPKLTDGLQEYIKEGSAQELEKARATVPIAGEEAVDEPLAFEGDRDSGFAWNPFTKPLTPPAGSTMDYSALNQMLDQSGINLPEGLSQKHKDRLMFSLNKVVKEGSAQDYKAFTDVLSKGLQDPDMFPAVLEDLTQNTGITLGRIQEGTYTSGQEPVYKEDVSEPYENLALLGDDQYAFEKRDKELEKVKDTSAEDIGLGMGFDPNKPSEHTTTGENILDAVPKVPSDATSEVPLEQQYETAKSDLQRNKIASQIRERNLEAGQYYDVDEGQVMFKDTDSQTATEGLKDADDIGFGELEPAGVSFSPKVDLVKQIPKDTSKKDLLESLRLQKKISPDVKIPDVKTDVEIPDVKTDILKTGGKIVGGAQEVLGAAGQLKTLTGEGTKEDKAIAGTQLTATGLKKGGELVTKKAGEEVAKKGLGSALSIGGRALAGGLGVYTGLKTALSKDATKEQQWGGGLQALGSGLMATGVGAGLGAILAGGGTLLSMFGGKKKRRTAPKQMVDLGRYYRGRR